MTSWGLLSFNNGRGSHPIFARLRIPSWSRIGHSQEKPVLPTHRVVGACSHLPLAGFGFCSLFGSGPPSQLTNEQSSISGLCKVQTVLPITGHIALS